MVELTRKRIMLENTKNEIEKIMNLYKDDLSGLTEKRKAEKEAQQKFIDEFDKLKSEIIWPVIVEVGNYLTEYGHDYHISEEKEYIDATAVYHPASIAFNIYPSVLSDDFKKPESAPYIIFIANPYQKKINITVSTMIPGEGGFVGSHGDFDFNQLSKELVETEIVNVLKNTLILH